MLGTVSHVWGDGKALYDAVHGFALFGLEAFGVVEVFLSVVIDSNTQDPVAAPQALGAASNDPQTVNRCLRFTKDLLQRHQFIVAGAGNEPVEVDPVPILLGMRSVAGTITGTSIEAEDTLSFGSQQDNRPMIETVPPANAAEADNEPNRWLLDIGLPG